MGDYRSKHGPIPDEWFENDIGPDPKRLDELCPPEVREAYIARLAERAAKAQAAAGTSLAAKPAEE